MLERLQEAKRRAKEAIVEYRARPARHTHSRPEAHIASEGLVNDGSLQPATSLSIDKGVFVFPGSRGQPPESDDFVLSTSDNGFLAEPPYLLAPYDVSNKRLTAGQRLAYQAPRVANLEFSVK